MTDRQPTRGLTGQPGASAADFRSRPPEPESRPASSQSAASIETGRAGAPVHGPPDAPVPRTFGRYTIERELGRGAMGVVYLAEDTQLHRKVALKIPQRASLQSPEALERFYREARTTATLRHSNICAIYDVGAIDGVHFLAMAYIPGKPINRFINKEKLPAARQVALLIRKIALALDEAHRQGVVHRDLKPSNVMLDDRGEPIVMDFGLARQMNTIESARLTQSGAILGTPAYMAPEQVRGEIDQIGPASDIYALGVMLYQFLTGELPFSGPVMMVFAQIVTQQPQRPSELRPEVDPALEAICLKMMAKDWRQRYVSMKEVAGALTQFVKSGSGAKPESRAATAPMLDGSQSELNLESLSAAPQSRAKPERELAPTSGNGPLVRLTHSWSGVTGSPWFWPAVGGLTTVLTGLAFVALYVQVNPVPTGIRAESNAGQPGSDPVAVSENPAAGNAANEVAPATSEGGFSVGATYRGRWKNFSPGQFGPDSETMLTIAVTERAGTLFVSEWKMHARNSVWIVKGDIAGDVSGQSRIHSEDVDLLGADHPNEGNTVLVAELLLAADDQPETIRGRADYTNGSHSEFEAKRVDPSSTDDPSSNMGCDRRQYSIMGGSWSVEGDELVQSDADREFAYLWFGDSNWTDYDYSVDVMRVEGWLSAALLFRYGDSSFYMCAVGHGSKSLAEIHTAERDASGQIRWWQVAATEQSLPNHEWTSLRVCVRGSQLRCLIWNGFDWSTLLEFTDDRFPTGRVGLRCVKSAFRFKNIRVTDPDGNILWEGFPAIGEP